MAPISDEQTDHDILILLKGDMCWMKKMMDNHLRHHWTITICSISAALSACTAIVLLLIRG